MEKGGIATVSFVQTLGGREARVDASFSFHLQDVVMVFGPVQVSELQKTICVCLFVCFFLRCRCWKKIRVK